MTLQFFKEAPADWERTTLGEVVRRGGGSIQTGPFGSQLHASDYVPDGVPSIMPVNIGDNRIIPDGIARITNEDAQRLSRHIVEAGDIIYSRRGDIERRALIRREQDGWFCGTGCLKIRLGTGVVDPEFTSYYFGHPEVRSWLVRHAVGATMPNLNTSIMEAIPFLRPSLDVQRCIADALGTLDGKIELNRRMSRTLERVARAIFRAWFVDFEPVKAKAAGARSFPGMPQEVFDALPNRLVESELGPIPEGWGVGDMGDIGRQRREQVAPEEVAEGTAYIGLEHMPRRSIALTDWGTADTVTSAKSRFCTGDILFGKLRPYFHKVGPAPVDGVCSTDIVVLSAKRTDGAAWLLMLVSSDEFVSHANRTSAGTKMPRTNWKDMASFPVALPPADLLGAFQQIARPMLDLIRQSIYESHKLGAMRDYLLPKLLRGEVRVDGVERPTS